MVFLALNGREVTDPEQRLYDAMIGIAERRLTKDQFTLVFRQLLAA